MRQYRSGPIQRPGPRFCHPPAHMSFFQALLHKIEVGCASPTPTGRRRNRIKAPPHTALKHHVKIKKTIPPGAPTRPPEDTHKSGRLPPACVEPIDLARWAAAQPMHGRQQTINTGRFFNTKTGGRPNLYWKFNWKLNKNIKEPMRPELPNE